MFGNEEPHFAGLWAAYSKALSPAGIVVVVGLGIDRATANQIADELALVGYDGPVSGKRQTWRNTVAGNTVSGAKPARLTRAKVDELLTDLADRAEAFNLDEGRPVRLSKIVAFGGVNTKHDRI